MIHLAPTPSTGDLCEIEGCGHLACYLLTFGEMARLFCEPCIQRRVTELLVFDG